MRTETAVTDAVAAPPRLAPFARFGVVFAWGLRRTLVGKRPYVTGALALLAGVGLGLLQRGTQDLIAANVWHVVGDGLLGIAVPLVALALVGGGFGEEVQDQTLVFQLVRPVSRRTLYVARYAAGLLPAMAVSAAMVVSLPLSAGVPLPAGSLLAIAALGALGVATVGALYYALAALFRRGLIAGLVYTFLVEGFFQFLPGSIQKLSLMHHVRSLFHRWTDDAFAALSTEVAREIDPSRRSGLHDPLAVIEEAAAETWSSVEGALLVCAGVVAAALFLGARAVARKDFPLKD